MLTDDQSASTTRSDPSLLVCLKGFIVVECVVGLKPQGNISIPGGALSFWDHPFFWEITFACRAFPRLHHSTQTCFPGWQHFKCFKVEGLPALVAAG